MIRDAIRTFLSEYEISKFEKGNLTTTITTTRVRVNTTVPEDYTYA